MLPAYLIFYVLVLLHLAHSYTLLPEVISTQFDAYGTPLRSMARADFAMFHIGFVVFMSGIFAGMGYFLTRLPVKYLNIPNKDYWLAPERRRETLQGLRHDLCVMGLIVGAFVMLIDYFVMDAAQRNARGVSPETLSILVSCMAAVTGLLVARLLIKFRRPKGTGGT
ncbi:MAG: hypothetical protein IT560_07525 [Alphaproteobacteria bacterium]|nr:hypothetical protein [Alphaproteobacteria bacterium]